MGSFAHSVFFCPMEALLSYEPFNSSVGWSVRHRQRNYSSSNALIDRVFGRLILYEPLCPLVGQLVDLSVHRSYFLLKAYNFEFPWALHFRYAISHNVLSHGLGPFKWAIEGIRFSMIDLPLAVDLLYHTASLQTTKFVPLLSQKGFLESYNIFIS